MPSTTAIKSVQNFCKKIMSKFKQWYSLVSTQNYDRFSSLAFFMEHRLGIHRRPRQCKKSNRSLKRQNHTNPCGNCLILPYLKKARIRSGAGCLIKKFMSDACVAQWLEQSTGNRKTWARIPAQSKASFFPQKDFQILWYLNSSALFAI